MDTNIKKLKIGILVICVNPLYWEYVGPMIKSAKQHLLKNHEVEFLLFSDMPENINYGTKLFPIESVEWPYPTLLRYHLFLQQEEELKKYDYLFYVDADMLFVDEVGDEILGEGLTMVQHPMYAFKRLLIPPYEPNPDSAAYIPRLGRISIDIEGKRWFDPLYAAGGFQGGKTDIFIKAMHSMKRSIDEDLLQNYIAIWNDESHWNKYLFENPPTTMLDPGYVYPDSLIKEYYLGIWGRDYRPRLVTLTKKFSTSKEGGEAIRQMIDESKTI